MTSDPVFEQQTFTIGQVVAALQPRFPDVSHSSLRFLEREGLIHSLRTTGGHRLYAADEVARIEQIMQDDAVVNQSYWRSLYRSNVPGVANANMHPKFEINIHHLGWA